MTRDYLNAFQTPQITADTWLNVTNRQGYALTGDWGFAIDPFDTGFRQRWFEYGADTVPRAHDWNPYQAKTCTLPGVWNLFAPELFHYEGGVWFARQIDDIRTAPGNRLILHIGAANYCARVFAGGRFIGRHLGGSTPFSVDISDHVQGRTMVLIHVENHRQPDRLPSHHFDWLHYGGLHRDIALYDLPAEHIRDVFARMDGGDVVVDVETTAGLSVAQVDIPALNLSAEVPLTGGQGQLRVAAKPRLWSPDDPFLHDVTVTAGTDTLHDRVGFRHIETSGNRVLINGQPTFLKGVCVHEDDAETGRVTSPQDIRRRFRHARELGANFLRLAHYPHHADVARIADEEGLMLWAEIPAYWSIRFDDPGTRADAQNQLAELIRRDRNRASVILWGLANETADTPPRNAFLTDLAALARRLDPSRPLAAACLFNQDTLTMQDRLAQVIDVVGINEYFGWYDDNIADLRRILDQYDLNKPLVISETGCDVLAGQQGPADAANTEAFGVRYYQNQIDAVEGHPAVAGFVPWLLYDFRSARRQNGAQRGWNRKGLIAGDKSTYKEVFGVVRDFYARVDATRRKEG